MTLQTERELFEACVDLAAGQRTAWLEEHCGDSALRERVLRLLRAHDSAQERGSLERSPIVTARRIGDFDLLERIGEGAMGEVWLAEQTAPVRRRVAVKIVKAGTGSREVIARFELERQALAMMSHPHIAHIVEAGTTDDGRPYFAMEYVPGIPLTKYCDQHRLGIDERLALFMLVCEAVQHAHHKGVIHRDLKPGNLLVTEIDGRPSPKVIDFGIAKAVALNQQPSRAHTMIGHLIGTPEYMSPEQAQLSPLDVDTRADVYSLGVVLHELLTGALPFKTSDPNATPATARAGAADARSGGAERAHPRRANPNRSRARRIAASRRDSSPRDSQAISTGSCSRRWRRIATAVTARPPSWPPTSAGTWPMSRSSRARPPRCIACASSPRAIDCRSRLRQVCSSRRSCSAR